MKTNIILSVILLIILFNCKKTDNIQTLTYSRTVLGGCNLNNHQKSSQNILPIDTISYSIFYKDSLDIFVGLGESCCGKYSYTNSIINDTIKIFFKTDIPGACNCLCLYSFDFKYSNLSKSYFYKIFLDTLLKYNGKISYN